MLEDLFAHLAFCLHHPLPLFFQGWALFAFFFWKPLGKKLLPIYWQQNSLNFHLRWLSISFLFPSILYLDCPYLKYPAVSLTIENILNSTKNVYFGLLLIWSLWITKLLFQSAGNLAKPMQHGFKILRTHLSKKLYFLTQCLLVTDAALIFLALLTPGFVIFNKVISVANVIVIAFIVLHLIEYKKIFRQSLQTVDTNALHMLTQIGRAGALILSLLYCLQSLGIPLAGLLTLSGLGTLLIGLAGKELLSNFMSGFIIYFEKPFVIGDDIKTVDQRFEGKIEKQGWRACALRLVDRELIYLPNSFFTSQPIINISRMNQRRLEIKFYLSNQSANKLEPVISQIQGYIDGLPSLEQQEIRAVRLQSIELGDLELVVRVYTSAVRWPEYSQIKHEILTKIVEILRANDAQFTRSEWLNESS